MGDYTAPPIRRTASAGALPTIAPASGVGVQVDPTSDRFLHQSVTLNPTGVAAATCAVALSPDNVTYTTVIVATLPLGVALDGSIPPLGVYVPAGWWVRFTVVNAVLGVGTFG